MFHLASTLPVAGIGCMQAAERHHYSPSADVLSYSGLMTSSIFSALKVRETKIKERISELESVVVLDSVLFILYGVQENSSGAFTTKGRHLSQFHIFFVSSTICAG